MIRLDPDDLVHAPLDGLERLATALGVCPRATQTTEHARRDALAIAILRAEARLARAPSRAELRRLVAERAAAARQRPQEGR